MGSVEIYNRNEDLQEEIVTVFNKNIPVEFFDIIVNVNEAILNHNYEKALEYVLRGLMSHLKSNTSNITIIESNSSHLKAIINNEVVDMDILHPHHGLHARAISENICIISNHVKSDPRSEHNTHKTHPEIKRFIGCPLIHPDSHKIIGEIGFGNRKSRYTTSHIEHLIPILPLISHLIINRDTNLIASKAEIIETKDKFLATMSHELRTPLNGIVGMATMLQDGATLSDKQQEYVQILMECSYQLMNLMNNILDFSKLSSKRLTLANKAFSLRETIQKSSDIMSGKIQEKSLHYGVDITDLPDKFMGDQQRLVQIINNIVSNAIKFTKKGSIHMKVGGKKIPNKSFVNSWRIDFSIRDTGIGISLTQQEKIFEVFHQIDLYSSDRGTGLGLSISKELIELMGGKISVESDGIDGKGSTFSFFIILEEEIDMNNFEDQYHDLLKSTRVLVVDDRSDIRIQLTDILFNWGCVPTAVTSAEEAIQLINYGMVFSVAIVDICMPFMSGVELAQELRQIAPSVKLIGLSSVDAVNGSDMFDHFLYKPVDKNKIFMAMIDCLDSTNSPKEIKQKRETLRKKKKYIDDLKVLIVEDDDKNSYVLNELLTSLGIKHTTIAKNGNECLKRMNKHKYDIVFMDIIMPVMDGIEAARHIRSMKHKPTLIAVSAAVQKSDKSRAQDVGFDGFLAKPIVKDKLKSILHPLLKIEE
jgi:signal transduction histidine kinase/DNA-binding response OmpR family regulator